MSAYVIAHLQEAAPHPEIAEYIERLPATFEPYGGRFPVHATQHEVKEGSWPGHVVMIGFPGISKARAWWDSRAYREIAPLRSRHIEGDIILVEGVPEGYDPTAAVKAMREALPDEWAPTGPGARARPGQRGRRTEFGGTAFGREPRSRKWASDHGPAGFRRAEKVQAR